MVYTSCIIGHIDRAVSIVGGLLTKEIKLKVATGFCKFSKVIFLKDSAIEMPHDHSFRICTRRDQMFQGSEGCFCAAPRMNRDGSTALLLGEGCSNERLCLVFSNGKFGSYLADDARLNSRTIRALENIAHHLTGKIFARSLVNIRRVHGANIGAAPHHNV